MAESFLCIILVVLFGSFALSLLPDTSAKPYLRLLCGAAAVLSIISPLVLQIRDGSLSDGLLLLFEEQSVEVEKYEEIYNNTKNDDKWYSQEQIDEFRRKNPHYREDDNCYEEEKDYRFTRRQLAEYYGYQYDEEYGSDQFLDDM